MSKLHEICKEYYFCSPETRAELEANGFDFTVCKFGITEFVGARMQMGFDVETNGAIPYPTFLEVWRALPENIEIKSLTFSKGLDYDKIYYRSKDGYSCQFTILHEISEIESACQLWLKLKKGGFLNG